FSIINNNIFTISIFDVTPMTEKAMMETGYFNYYSSNVLQQFMNDLLVTINNISKKLQIDIKILLKHKRPLSPDKSQEYINFVDNITRENKNLHKLPVQDNLFDIISNSDLSIAIPYSSPVFVAKYLSKPSAFYDPTMKIINTEIENNYFISGRKELYTFIVNAAQKYLTKLELSFKH
ncbi:MAG: hypothetical protein KC414_12395, partial [Romboutsia sp.]|nr:hypothetical protein [Romboutsia sp.]